jgi:serpin B
MREFKIQKYILFMKKLLPILLIGLLGITACSHLFNNGDPNAPKTLSRELTASEKKLVKADHTFSYEIFSQTVAADKKANIFISPLSISMALGMTMNGANGETKNVMKKALHIQELGQKSINESYASLIELLSSADPKVDMKLANSIWTRKGFLVQEEFTKTCKAFFKARVDSLDFSNSSAVDRINQWISDNTEGLIDAIIEGQIPDNVVMYLINAIYFKGNWRYRFDPENTTKDEFRFGGEAVNVDMMSQENDFSAYISDQVRLLDLPYGDSLFTMTLMMPGDEHKSIEQFVQEDLSASNVDRWISKMSKGLTRIQVPKFQLEYNVTMNSILKDMGMGNAFSKTEADFSNINPYEQLFISKVLHKSFIKVDEEGTEAAAATSVSTGVTSVGPGIRTINFNRPFVFVIRERTSGTILFMGKMGNPGK